MADEPAAQTRGAWPTCGRCGLPEIPRGLGTGLKPAHEPIVLARKPLAGTVAGNVLKHGTGALNVDGCRVGTDDDTARARAFVGDTAAPFGRGAAMGGNGHDAGRWPANVILDPEAAALLDEQTGESTSPAPYVRATSADSGIYGVGLGAKRAGHEQDGYGDKGGASRFFPTFSADNPPWRYQAKASSAERNAGLDNPARHGKVCVCRIHEDQALSPLRDTSEPTEADGSDSSTIGSGSSTTDPSLTDSKSTISTGSRPTTGSATSPSSAPSTTSESTPPTTDAVTTEPGSDAATAASSGSHPTPSTTTSAAKAGLSTADADPATSGSLSRPSSSAPCADCGGVIEGAFRNTHPTQTVKPIDLMRWLVRLVTPPGGTVLDPFCGSGTTGCACALEGFEFVGVEREEEYALIAEARIAFWAKQPPGVEVEKVLAANAVRSATADTGQGTLL